MKAPNAINLLSSKWKIYISAYRLDCWKKNTHKIRECNLNIKKKSVNDQKYSFWKEEESWGLNKRERKCLLQTQCGNH